MHLASGSTCGRRARPRAPGVGGPTSRETRPRLSSRRPLDRQLGEQRSQPEGVHSVDRRGPPGRRIGASVDGDTGLGNLRRRADQRQRRRGPRQLRPPSSSSTVASRSRPRRSRASSSGRPSSTARTGSGRSAPSRSCSGRSPCSSTVRTVRSRAGVSRTSSSGSKVVKEANPERPRPPARKGAPDPGQARRLRGQADRALRPLARGVREEARGRPPRPRDEIRLRGPARLPVPARRGARVPRHVRPPARGAVRGVGARPRRRLGARRERARPRGARVVAPLEVELDEPGADADGRPGRLDRGRGVADEGRGLPSRSSRAPSRATAAAASASSSGTSTVRLRLVAPGAHERRVRGHRVLVGKREQPAAQAAASSAPASSSENRAVSSASAAAAPPRRPSRSRRLAGAGERSATASPNASSERSAYGITGTIRSSSWAFVDPVRRVEVPTRLVHGLGAIGRVGELVRELGRRPAARHRRGRRRRRDRRPRAREPGRRRRVRRRVPEPRPRARGARELRTASRAATGSSRSAAARPSTRPRPRAWARARRPGLGRVRAHAAHRPDPPLVASRRRPGRAAR